MRDRPPVLPALDVAVIGASSAGLYAAHRLAQAGRTVAVFEQSPELAPSRRTLIVTPELRRWWGELAAVDVLHQTPIMAMTAGDASARVELADPDLIVDRAQLAQGLARRAEAAGASIHYGYRFQALTPAGDSAALLFQADGGGETARITARAVIGADGVFSDVARAAGLRRARPVPIVQAEVRLPAGWDPAVTQVWFDAEETRFFYWLIPESTTRGVVGLVANRRREARPLLQRFLSRHRLEPLAYQASQVAMYDPRLRPWTRVGSAPVLLIGDAAGQVKVTTVGGTVSGLWGAAAAVSALLHGTSYDAELTLLRRELNLHWAIRKFLDQLDTVGYGTLLSDLTPGVQRFLARHNRDEMAATAWRLLSGQPLFPVRAVQLLLTQYSRRLFHTTPGRSARPLPRQRSLSGD